MNFLGEEIEGRLKEYEESLRRLSSLKIENINDMWIEYDKQMDILYIYFGKEEAEESLMLENDVIVLINKDKLIGIIINNFAQKYLQ